MHYHHTSNINQIVVTAILGLFNLILLFFNVVIAYKNSKVNMYQSLFKEFDDLLKAAKQEEKEDIFNKDEYIIISGVSYIIHNPNFGNANFQLYDAVVRVVTSSRYQQAFEKLNKHTDANNHNLSIYVTISEEYFKELADFIEIIHLLNNAILKTYGYYSRLRLLYNKIYASPIAYSLKKVLFKDLADLSDNYMNFATAIINKSTHFTKNWVINYPALKMPVIDTMVNAKGQFLLYNENNPFFSDYYFDIAKDIKKTTKKFKRKRFWNI
jgi:hypothetical protein